MSEISATEYRFLFQKSLPLAVDTDTEGVSRSTLFTPASHRSALDPNVTLVKGAREVGKTYWFTSLLDKELRELAADEYELPRLRNIEPLTGFGLDARNDKYPDKRTLAQLLELHFSALDIWRTVGLVALGTPEMAGLEWKERVPWVITNPEDAARAMEEADQSAGKSGTTKLFLFDALEHLHRERKIADRLAGGILEFALDLRLTTKNLRAKVFIRHDMLASAPTDFSDSSKLTSNAADLTWNNQDLYGLLFQHLGNSTTPLAARFREETGQWRSTGNRFTPPEKLIGDTDAQTTAFIEIAGPYMGTNHRKGHSYPWLPNHLADGKGQTSPRTFLVALRSAADETAKTNANHSTALHWDAIRSGVQEASQTRVAELREDQPWVANAIRPLDGHQVPIDQSTVVTQWESKDLLAELSGTDKNGPAGPVADTYPKLIEELISLGMMTRRNDGRLDLPDVYRIAFNLGRKGGVPRVRG